jgi:hypothetical protein
MLTQIVGIYAFLFLLLVVIISILGGSKATPVVKGKFLGKPMPALALEFARKGSGLGDVVTNAGEGGVRAKLLNDLVLDSLFIPLYLLLYVGIAAVLARRGGAWALAAALAAACAVGAAASDGAENLAMARLIEGHGAAAPRPGAPEGPDIAGPGFRKWALIFVTLALLSLTFWDRRGPNPGPTLAWVIFGLCLLVAALGLVGLAVLRDRPEEFRPVQLAFVLQLLLTVLVGVAFTFYHKLFAPAASG